MDGHLLFGAGICRKLAPYPSPRIHSSDSRLYGAPCHNPTLSCPRRDALPPLRHANDRRSVGTTQQHLLVKTVGRLLAACWNRHAKCPTAVAGKLSRPSWRPIPSRRSDVPALRKPPNPAPPRSLLRCVSPKTRCRRESQGNLRQHPQNHRHRLETNLPRWICRFRSVICFIFLYTGIMRLIVACRSNLAAVRRCSARWPCFPPFAHSISWRDRVVQIFHYVAALEGVVLAGVKGNRRTFKNRFISQAGVFLLARTNIATSGSTHHSHPILHLQRTIGNQAVQR